MRRIIAGSAVVAAVLLLGVGRAQAEEKLVNADALVNNVKKACSKELSTFCKGVPQGEGRILACLYAFQDKVSDKCVYAVYDAAEQLEKAANAVRFAASQCQDDLEKFCAEVKPGKGRGLACLQKNDKKVSQTCKDALVQTGLAKKT